jgi:N2-(2-carboxyethyl)arginine synthase
MKVSEQILRYLELKGISKIYGIVGRESASILFNECPGIDFVLTRHEFSAGVIATSVSRFTSSPQVCFSTLGPGSTNLMTALATAALDHYPLIGISAQIETHELNHYYAHQCVDCVSMARPIVKFAYEIRHPREILGTLKRAFDICMTEPLGPVFISIPNDILQQDAVDINWLELADYPVMSAGAVYPDNQLRLEQAISILDHSSQPLIAIGDAALKAGASSDIIKLAHTYNIPVVTSYSAKGALPPDDPLNYGAITPHMDALLEFPALKTIFDPVDCILLIGYDLVEHLMPAVWQGGHRKKIIRVSSYQNNTPIALIPDVDIVGPFSTSLKILINSGLSIKIPHDISSVRARCSALMADKKEDPNGLLPHQVLSFLNEHYPDYILANDVGQHRHASAIFYRANQPLDFVTSAGLSSFGTGLPLGIGAKLANPNRNVVVIAGDVGFHSNSGELETAVRLKLKMTIVVFVNDKAGLIERYQIMGHGKVNPGVINYGEVDFVKLAEANGCHGIHVKQIKELPDALLMADSYQGPTVIQIPIHYPNRYVNQFSRNYHAKILE